MVAKLFVVVLGIAVIAASLLAVRQQRLETAHAISELHQRLHERERSVWDLRSSIATRSRPELVRRRLLELDEAWLTVPDATSFDPRAFRPGAYAPIALETPGDDPGVSAP